MPTALADCTATELIALYASGAASPVEALAAVQARIALLNPVLNAFCHLAGESATQSAIKSEAAWLAHRHTGSAVGALEGVPTSIKDLILTQGMPTLRGSKTVDPAQAWEVDAPVAARIKAAGAVLIGKTTTPEFGCKGETNSLLTGISRNPWNPTKTPGGSSGGTAAAVAAGMGPLSVGTDGAGSVRIPAAFCGNFGLKPSFGRVPAYPLSPFGSVAHLGPHTMSVQDAALLMNVIAQPDARDWTSLPFDGTDYLQAIGLQALSPSVASSSELRRAQAQRSGPQPADAPLHGLRIAYSPTLGYASCVDPEIAAAVAAAAREFESLGAHVSQVDPGFEDPLEITTGLWFVGAWTIYSGLSPAQQALTDPDFAAQAQLGAQLSALQVQQLHARRGVLGSHMRQFMQRFDLLLTPSVAIPAFDARPAGHSPMSSQAMLGWTPFSYPFNLTQQPACSMPCGLTRAGLPMGLQLVGPMFGDALVLRAARAYETRHPIARPALPDPALRTV